MGTQLDRRWRSGSFVFGLAALAAAACHAQSNGPTTDPAADLGLVSPPIQYPFAYHAPKVAEVTDVLDRVRHRLETAITPRFIDRRTKQPITDVSKAAAGVILDPGGEGKFNPISYPMGVINNGMLSAAEATGDPRFAQFPVRWFEFYAKYLPALSQWPGTTLAPPATQPVVDPDAPAAATRPAESAETADAPARGGFARRIMNPFRALLAPNSLDDCGAMVSAMIRARVAGLGPDLGPVIQRAIDHVHQRQFRLPDGTLARHRPVVDSIWADDMYMGVSILAQAGKMTGDKAYYDDAARQVLQISQHLWLPEKKLMTHGWNSVNPDDRPTYCWGRANGWCLMAMADLLTVLPDDHPDRPAVLKQFRALAQGIASLQAGDGLWHQMLDRPDTYTETSCSAMFDYAIARGVNRGWLAAAEYGPVAESAWCGLAARVDRDGHVTGTCIGTGYASDYVYYYHRPQVDDVHGYGPVLLAGAEIIRLAHDARFGSNTGADSRGPITYLPRTRRGGR